MTEDRLTTCYQHQCGRYVLLTCDYQNDSEVGLTGWGCSIERGENTAWILEELDMEPHELCECDISRAEQSAIIQRTCWDLSQSDD